MLEPQPVSVWTEKQQIENAIMYKKLQEKYSTFVKKGQEKKCYMIEHFTKEFKDIHPSVISTTIDYCDPDSTRVSLLGDYMFIHLTFNRMLKNARIDIVTNGRCPGHRINVSKGSIGNYINHCAGQCLDCGAEFCSCCTIHCCCY